MLLVEEGDVLSPGEASPGGRRTAPPSTFAVAMAKVDAGRCALCLLLCLSRSPTLRPWIGVLRAGARSLAVVNR